MPTDDEAVFGDLSAALDCLRFDLLHTVLNLLRGELSLRRIGLEQRIGTETPPAVFIAPRLTFRTNQVVELRQDRSWLVRFLGGPSPNRYAALRVHAELAASPAVPPSAEDFTFQVTQPSFIRHAGQRVVQIQLASGQELTVTEPADEDGPFRWRLEDGTIRKGLPMEGVALLVETLIRWRATRDERDTRTIRASALARSRTKLGELLHVFATGISDVGALLRDMHGDGVKGPLPLPMASGEPVNSRVERWQRSYREFIEELWQVGDDWHPDLGCRLQFRDWRARMLVDLNRGLEPVERGPAGERLQFDFRAERQADEPVRLSYFIPDVLSDGDFLRSVAVGVMEAVDDIEGFPTPGSRERFFEAFFADMMGHFEAGRIRLLRIEIAPAETDEGTATDTDILVVNGDGESPLRQVFLYLKVRVGRFPELSFERIESARLLGFLKIKANGERRYVNMRNGRSKFSNFEKVGRDQPELFKRTTRHRQSDGIHDYFARLITIMHRWQVLIDDLEETQA